VLPFQCTPSKIMSSQGHQRTQSRLTQPSKITRHKSVPISLTS
jgi:hypothetical protein